MNRSIWMLGLSILLAGADWAPARADIKSTAAREVAEYVLQRFGRKAVQEGTEVLAARIESAAARHGEEVLMAVRKVGPRALPLVEEAGARGGQAAKVMARYGEEGATWIVARPQAMSLVAKHGEAAAGVLVKHSGGIAEPLVEKCGPPAIRALESVGPQGGRRMAMMMTDGDLARIGRTEEVLEVIAKYGNRGAAFVWENKGALAVATTLTAFLAKPEAFINGAKDITQVAAENAVRPIAEVPGKVADKAAEKVADGIAKGTNWTVVFSLVVLALGGLAVLRWRPKPRPEAKCEPQTAKEVNDHVVK